MTSEELLHEITVEAWNGLDALVRILNIARRAKLNYYTVKASIEAKKVRISLLALGSNDEADWLVAKLSRMPEVYNVVKESSSDMDSTLVA